jgi:hypothetical protein
MPKEEGTMSKTPIKLTETERTTIVNALTVAARQYEIDAERASELAMHGMTVFEPAEKLAKQFQELATDSKQLRDKMTFLWEHMQLRTLGITTAAASHSPGQSKRPSRAPLCATTTSRPSPSSIARTSPADEPPASY